MAARTLAPPNALNSKMAHEADSRATFNRSWNPSSEEQDAWSPSQSFGGAPFASLSNTGPTASAWNASEFSWMPPSAVNSTSRSPAQYSYDPWAQPGPASANPRRAPISQPAGIGLTGLTASTASAESGPTHPISQIKASSQRAGSNRDEFDGPHQLLDRPIMQGPEPSEEDLICLPTHLEVQEQDYILTQVNTCLSTVAFNFVAMYQFPIPLEPNKRRVRSPADREWNEWVFLLKRLATKRRIPARVLYNGEIRQLNTILENSLEMRHVAMHRSRPIKDDRNILQLISAGTQVAKMLKDASAMRLLDKLYVDTERLINSRN